MPTTDLRLAALQALACPEPEAKVALTQALDLAGPLDATAQLEPPATPLPGRPARPQLVPHAALKPGALSTPTGLAALLHSIAHIEFNAINLALDVCWRFAGMPDRFYRDWLRIAQEESQHFSLLREHLQSMGYDYGDFDAHNALWDMAERTRHDILARIALVPRTLEARGLDASPAVKRKLLSAGDKRGGEILDVILRDEIGHVAAGNHWFGHLCAERGLDPVATYAELAERYQAPRLRAPFNLEARRLAGFSQAELDALQQTNR